MSMPTRLVVLLVVVCGVVAPAAAVAAPSLLGYTGLVLVPSADVLGMSEWNAAAFTTELTDGEDFLAVGIGLPAGLEVGLLRIDPEGGSAETLLHAKYRIQPLLVGGGSLAVGMFDITDEIDSNPYVVYSRSLAPDTIIGTRRLLDPKVHVGLGSGGALDGLFAGVSAVAVERITLMAEYDSDDINLGARLLIAPKLQFHAGWLGDDSDLAIGLSYNEAY